MIMRYIPILVCLLASLAASAQQALDARVDVSTAVVNPDHSVTIRLQAPSAKQVLIDGDLVAGRVEMSKDSNGVFAYTTAPLEPELYTYRLLVDGISMTDPGTVHTVRDISRVMDMVLVEDAASVYGVHDVAHGSVLSVWYPSATKHAARRLCIYLPPHYFETTERYPVLYLLHGSGGDEQAWLELGRTAQILDNQIAAGKAKPMIVVMPNGNMTDDATPGQGVAGLVVPGIPAEHRMDGVFEFYFREVMDFVDASFRTKAESASRAIAGLSMGGYHAFWISLNGPMDFRHVGLFSAVYFWDNTTEKVSPVYADYEQKMKALFAQQPDYHIYIGSSDFLYQQNVKMRAYMDEHQYKYRYLESTGGHEWRNWRKYLTDFVTHLF